MSFSYNPSLASPSDYVRLLLGDTTSPSEVSNEEIHAILLREGGNECLAAAELAMYLSAQYSKQVDESFDGHSKSYSQLSANFEKLARTLIKKGAQGGGGISFSGFTGVDSDGGITHAKFTGQTP